MSDIRKDFKNFCGRECNGECSSECPYRYSDNCEVDFAFENGYIEGMSDGISRGVNMAISNVFNYIICETEMGFRCNDWKKFKDVLEEIKVSTIWEFKNEVRKG